MTALTAAEPIGLLAGAGRFPILFAEKARANGIPVVCIAVEGMADPALASLCHRFHWLKRMSLGFVIRSLRQGGVRQWTMAGKFHKQILFQPRRLLRLLPDWRAIRFWFFRRRSDNADDSILLQLIAELRTEGLECVSALDLCPELIVRSGTLTRRLPSAAEERDVRFGWTAAKTLGRLDIGQSVMVRDGAILAVEAIEGTDRAIARAGELCGQAPFVVVKVAKPQQDMRFDVPTVGLTTIETMHKSGGKVLAIEAGKTIILDESQTIALADRLGITITAIEDEQNPIRPSTG